MRIAFLKCQMATLGILLLISSAAYSQADTSAVKSWMLEGEARQEWEMAENYWRDTLLPGCLSGAGIVVSCAGCDRVMMSVIFSFDHSGKIVAYEILRQNMCYSDFTPELQECFLSFFLKREWGMALAGKRVEALLGRALKC